MPCFGGTSAGSAFVRPGAELARLGAELAEPRSYPGGGPTGGRASELALFVGFGAGGSGEMYSFP